MRWGFNASSTGTRLLSLSTIADAKSAIRPGSIFNRQGGSVFNQRRHTFDAEFPDRVRQSLNELRSRFAAIRGELLDGTPLDGVLLSLTKTILIFFNAVESVDLKTLRCNSGDPEWLHFSDALATLRKSLGLQIANLATAYDIAMSGDLQNIAPLRD